jgi:signal transduction histidine kinase
MLKSVRSPWALFGAGVVLATTLALLFMPGLVSVLFSPGFFMPHRHCYLDNPRMIWLQGLSDFAIGASYMAISGALAYLVWKARKDIPFEWMFLAFGLFIFSCGWTHFMEVWTLWHPTYWLSGAIKAVTAMASLATGFGIFWLLPHIFGLIQTAKLSEQRRRELEKAHRQLEQRSAELAAANKELEAFGYSVSHDLRAPLRHMGSFIKLLDKSAGPSLDEKSRRYVQVINGSADRMGQLIDDLLTLSRVGRAAMAEGPVNLRQLVDEARQELAPAMAGRSIEWTVGPLPEVRGDYTLLRSVLVNLLSNALKYSRQRHPARIEVGSRQPANEVICYVRDNGSGFDMQFVDKLFGAFQRLHRAEEFEGTGVGLATVRRIIQRHGGRTWAEGALDQGATFYFSLPAERIVHVQVE